MANAADRLAVALTSRDIRLIRFEAAKNRELYDALLKLNGETAKLIRDIAPPDVVRRAAQIERLQRLGGELGRAADKAYLGFYADLSEDLSGFASIEAEAAREIVNKALGAEIASKVAPREFPEPEVEGVALKEAVARQARDWAESVKDAVGRAVRAGRDTGRAVTDAIGTRSARFRDGVLGPAFRRGQALIVTASRRAANDARTALWTANADVVRGVQAVNPLDHRTSDICRARAGGAWELETGREFQSSRVGISFPGPPPWHWRCRTTLVPIFYPLSKLERVNQRLRSRLLQLTADERARLDGKPGAGLTFDDWLRSIPAAEREEVLGPGRYALWRDGKITSRDLVNQNGRPLTLEELRKP